MLPAGCSTARTRPSASPTDQPRIGPSRVPAKPISFVFFLLSLPGLLLAGIGFAVASSQAAVAGWVLAVVGILLVAAVMVAGRAASAAFGAVLCRYGANGVVSDPFDEADLGSIARPAA